MYKIIHLSLVFSSLIAFSGCSITPGIPGLKNNSSRHIKPQKEGVDYKLVIINPATIQQQKPFDYATYISSKKQKRNTISSIIKDKSTISNKLQNNTYKQNNYSYSNNKQSQQTDSNSYLLSRKKNQIPSPTPFSGITSNDVKANYQYLIGKGDILSITVWDHPELSSPSQNSTLGGHVVDREGRFYFPYSGKIQASGRSVKEIRNELEKKLGSFITKPQVSVRVADFRSQKVYTSGAILKPSTLVINDVPTTIRDAISKSGGLIPKEFTGFATLARNNTNISIDLNRMLKHNDNRQNFILRNGDRLNIIERDELAEFNRKLGLDVQKEKTLGSVRTQIELNRLRTLKPIELQHQLERERALARLKKELERELKSEQAKVFVMGEVAKPGSVIYQVEDGMTLAEAINDAGSFKEETVNPKGIFVIRKSTERNNIPTIYQLPITSVQSMFLAEQFAIQPRDIVYITATPSIRWNRLIGQLLPSLAILNTFRNFR